MELKGYFEKCHLFWAVQSSVDLLPPTQSAIYAFYDALYFSRGKLIDEIDTFVTHHGRHIALTKSEWPFSLSLKFRGNPERFRGQGRELAEKLDPGDHRSVSETLLFLSFLNEPLYIGKTDNIRTRFRAHHDNGFLFSMKAEFKRSPDEFVILVFYCEENRARLLESVLIQSINPPFCDQKT